MHLIQFLLLCLLACMVLETSHQAILSADQQLLAVLNLSLNTLKTNGKLNSILSKYSLDDNGLSCTSSLKGQTTWPATSDLGSTMKQILSNGVIRFCRSETLTQTYFNFTTGMEFELGREIAALISTQYGKTVGVSWQRLATKTAGFFPTVIDALSINTCDAGLGNIAITPDREQLANFTCPYVNTYSAYLQGPRNLTMDLSVMSSLNQSGIIIAALPGTIHGNIAASFTNATFMPVPDTTTGAQRVADGLASVFIGEYAFFATVNCPTCKAYKFGNATQLAILTRQVADYSVRSAAGEMLRYSSMVMILSFLIALLL